jgi:hypothetical protein
MQLLNVLGYKERKLPLKYLGVPLISTKLTSPDCFILVDNILWYCLDLIRDPMSSYLFVLAMKVSYD